MSASGRKRTLGRRVGQRLCYPNAGTLRTSLPSGTHTVGLSSHLCTRVADYYSKRCSIA